MLVHSAEMLSAIQHSRAEEVSRGPDNHAGLSNLVSMPKPNDSTIWSKVIVIADTCSNCWQAFPARKPHVDWLTYILSVQWAKNGPRFVYILISCQKWNLPPPEAPSASSSLPLFQRKNSSISSTAKDNITPCCLSPVLHIKRLYFWCWQCSEPKAHKYNRKTEPSISQDYDKYDLHNGGITFNYKSGRLQCDLDVICKAKNVF